MARGFRLNARRLSPVEETYQVVDCENGSSWAFPDRTIAMMCAAGVHVSGHEVEVVLLTLRDDGRLAAEAVQRLPGVPV
jgi:predicted ATPase